MSKEALAKELSLIENDRLIRELTLLKVRKTFKCITEEKFKEEVIKLDEEYIITDFAEEMSKIAFNVIVRKADLLEERDENMFMTFNEDVEVYFYGCKLPMRCDAVLFGTDEVEIIKIIPSECDFIHASKCEMLKLLALGIIDKYLTRISSDKIKLTIIQPNLMIMSQYETEVVELLHQCEYGNLFRGESNGRHNKSYFQ